MRDIPNNQPLKRNNDLFNDCVSTMFSRWDWSYTFMSWRVIIKKNRDVNTNTPYSFSYYDSTLCDMVRIHMHMDIIKEFSDTRTLNIMDYAFKDSVFNYKDFMDAFQYFHKMKFPKFHKLKRGYDHIDLNVFDVPYPVAKVVVETNHFESNSVYEPQRFIGSIPQSPLGWIQEFTTIDQNINLFSYIACVFGGHFTVMKFLAATKLYLSTLGVNTMDIITMADQFINTMLSSYSVQQGPAEDLLEQAFTIVLGKENAINLTSSALYHKSKRVVSMSFLASFLAMTGLVNDPESVIQWVDSKLPPLIRTFDVADLIVSFVRDGAAAIKAKDFSVLLKKDKWLDWCFESEFILCNMTNSQIMKEEGYIDGENYTELLIKKLYDNIEIGKQYILYLKHKNLSYDSAQVSRVVGELVDALAIARARSQASSDRAPPFAVLVVGLPGIGKTGVGNFLISVLADALKLSHHDSNIWSGNPDMVRPDDLTMQQIWYFNEVISKIPNMNTSHFDLLRALDGTPFLIEKAALKDKGRNYVSPKAVVGLTNFADLKSDLVYLSRAAVLRRWALHIFVELKEKDASPTALTRYDPCFIDSGLKYYVYTIQPLSEHGVKYVRMDKNGRTSETMDEVGIQQGAFVHTPGNTLSEMREMVFNHAQRFTKLQHDALLSRVGKMTGVICPQHQQILLLCPPECIPLAQDPDLTRVCGVHNQIVALCDLLCIERAKGSVISGPVNQYSILQSYDNITDIVTQHYQTVLGMQSITVAAVGCYWGYNNKYPLNHFNYWLPFYLIFLFLFSFMLMCCNAILAEDLFKTLCFVAAAINFIVNLYKIELNGFQVNQVWFWQIVGMIFISLLFDIYLHTGYLCAACYSSYAMGVFDAAKTGVFARDVARFCMYQQFLLISFSISNLFGFMYIILVLYYNRHYIMGQYSRLFIYIDQLINVVLNQVMTLNQNIRVHAEAIEHQTSTLLVFYSDLKYIIRAPNRLYATIFVGLRQVPQRLIDTFNREMWVKYKYPAGILALSSIVYCMKQMSSYEPKSEKQGNWTKDMMVVYEKDNLSLGLKPFNVQPPAFSHPTTRIKDYNVDVEKISNLPMDANKTAKAQRQLFNGLYKFAISCIGASNYGSNATYCLRLDANRFVSVKHVWTNAILKYSLENSNRPPSQFVVRLVSANNNSGFTTDKIVFVNASHLVHIGDDYTLFTIPSLGTAPDLKIFLPSTVSTLPVFDGPGLICHFDPGVVGSFVLEPIVLKHASDAGVLGYMYKTNRSVAGNCGLPIISILNDYFIIIGLHRSLLQNGCGFCELLYPPVAPPYGLVRYSENTFGGKSVELQSLSVRSELIHISHLAHYGKIIGTAPEYQVSDSKSHIIKTVLHDYYNPKFVIPKLKAFEHEGKWISPYLVKLDKMATIPRAISIEYMQWAQIDLLEDLLSIIPDYIRPYNFYEALNGVPGSKPINTKAAMGPPWHGKKSEYFFRDDDNFLVMDPVVSNSVTQWIDNWKLNYSNNLLVKYAIKDEVISPDKELEGRTRLFCVMDATYFVLTRIFIQPIVDCTRNMRNDFEWGVGINAASDEWKILLEYMQYFGLDDLCVDADAKFWDALCRVIIYVFEVFEQLALNRSELREYAYIYRCLGLELISHFALFKGDMVEMFDVMLSGMGGTTEFNCACMSLIWRIVHCFIAVKTDLPGIPPKYNPPLPVLYKTRSSYFPFVNYFPKVPKFRQYCRLKCFGDDNMIHVPPIYKAIVLNAENFCETFDALGVVLTSAQKNEPLKWKKAVDLEFLKRKFVKYNEHVFCPLVITSIYKSLCFMPADPRIIRQSHLGVLLNNASREMFFHGLDRFEHWVIERNQLVLMLKDKPAYQHLSTFIDYTNFSGYLQLYEDCKLMTFDL